MISEFLAKRRFAGTALVVAAALCIISANAFTIAWHGKRAALAREWQATGDAALAQRKPDDAVLAYRNGLAYAHDDHALLLRLSEALIAANQEDEAEAYLRSLVESSPGSGRINLMLANLAARKGDVSNAVRFYRAAVLGEWPEPIQQRYEARMQLTRFLITKNRTAEARAELYAIAAEMPRSIDQRLAVAQLFENIGDDGSAINIYRGILAEQHTNAQARIALAGALLRDGDFRSAHRELSLPQLANNDAARNLLAVASAGIRLNPLVRGLSNAQESARTLAILDIVSKRVAACAPVVPADVADILGIQAARQSATPEAINNDPQNLQRAVTFASATEQKFRSCKGVTPEDSAIMLLAKEIE